MTTNGCRFRVGMSLAFGLLWTSAAVGDGPLFPGAQYTAGREPASVAIGDLNGDQIPDLAVANPEWSPLYEYGSVSVLLGVGDGTFAPAVHYAAGYEPLSVAIGDLNGDQVPDLAVASGGGVSVLPGIGDGTFSAAVNYTTGRYPQSVAIGDLNGDQVPDLAVAHVGSYPLYDDVGVSVLLGVGDGTFAAAVQYDTGDQPVSVTIGDLNGDQVPDLVTANPSGDNVAVLLGVGDGTFVAAAHYASFQDPVSVAIGDLDGDQVPDLAVANNGMESLGNTVSVLLGIGDGTFAAAVRYALGRDPVSVAIGDVNGDQVPDLAVASAGTYPRLGSVSVLLGVGDGTFVAAVDYIAGVEPRSVAIGDLDGDQVPDLAVANIGSSPFFLDGSVSVLLGVGDGVFSAAMSYAAGNGPECVAIGDLNGDQVPDMAVANPKWSPLQGGSVAVLLGVGDGRFSPAVYYAAGEFPKSVAIGDLDGDQVPDLAVANGGSNNVSVLLGVGDGTFAAAVHSATGYGPLSVAIGDLDGDQVPDLAVANWFSDNVSVLLGVGDGTFAAAVHYAAGDGPSSIAIGDLNGDQVLDLAVANRAPFASMEPSVSLLLGLGDGTFAAAVDYTAGDGPSSVAIGDLDGDGIHDLVVANAGSYPSYDDGSISVLLGLGDGTFTAAVNYASYRPQSIAIGDLDGDQVPDLAVANRYSLDISVLLGVGDGTFAAAMHYGVGNTPVSVAIGDLDGNGTPDLAVANDGTYSHLYERNITVLLNLSRSPGDIDGDDDVDLDDFAVFEGCMGGPGVTTPPPGCDPADFERAQLEGRDGDVDLRDFAAFHRY